MLNGDGLRVVLWVAGCSHGCPGCQNPVTWDPCGGLLFDQAAQEELFTELEKDYISGVTFSGGDPLHPANKAEIGDLAREIKANFPDKTVWLYTGDLWKDICADPMMAHVDVVVDGEFHIAELDTKLLWKGSKNQRVINVKKTLSPENTDPTVPVLHCGDYA